MGLGERIERQAPGLRRGLPLLFFGALFLVAGGYFLGAHSTAGIGRFPIWLYLLPVGAVAFIGGAATSLFPEEDEEEIVEGSSIGENLVAISVGDWEEFVRWSAARSRAAAPGGPARRTPLRPATPAGATTPGARNTMAASFAFAPALAANAPASNRRRGRSGSVDPEEPPSTEAPESKESEEPAASAP